MATGSGLILQAALVAALALSACGPRPSGDSGEPPCDRVCLEDTLTAYMRALIARNPSAVPLAAGATLVEDLQPVVLGEGTWTSVTAMGGYRHVVADQSSGHVAAIVVVEEGGAKVLLDLSAQIVDRAIARIEAMMVRDTEGARRYEQVALPPAAFSEAVDSSQRVSRQALVAAADRYYGAMSPGVSRDFSFLADGCERMEHGNTASLGCRTQFDAGFLPFVTRVRDRRYLAVDEERQTVFATVFLDHDGSVRSATTPSGSPLDAPPYFAVPRTLRLAEVLRFEHGRIRYIETTLTEYPYGSRPVAAAPVPVAPRSVSPAPAGACDRDCLRTVATRWLDTLVSRRRDGLFDAPGLRYTENGQALQVGDGLWRTVTAVSRDRRVLVDPDSGTAGVLTGVIEHGVPGALAARLQVADGRVTELEAVVVRQELSPPDGETATLFAPRLPDAFDPARFASDWTTFDRAAADTARMGFAPGPLAQFRSQMPRERRTLVRDASSGLALEITVTDVSGALRGEAVTTGPFAILGVSVSRMAEGQATVSHSIVRALPFGSRSGWVTPAPATTTTASR